MPKVILVAIDGSGHASRAVTAAAQLSVALGAKLVLMTVLTDSGLPPELAEFAKSEGAYVSEVLTEMLDQAEDAARAAGATDITQRIAEGDPTRQIIASARDVGADVVVLGRRGLGTVREILVGSVSHKVIQLAECPCMVVP